MGKPSPEELIAPLNLAERECLESASLGYEGLDEDILAKLVELELLVVENGKHAAASWEIRRAADIRPGEMIRLLEEAGIGDNIF